MPLTLDTIRLGPEPGEWDGSASYVGFKPASAGTYLFVGRLHWLSNDGASLRAVG
jgi:hypothetical protein